MFLVRISAVANKYCCFRSLLCVLDTWTKPHKQCVVCYGFFWTVLFEYMATKGFPCICTRWNFFPLWNSTRVMRIRASITMLVSIKWVNFLFSNYFLNQCNDSSTAGSTRSSHSVSSSGSRAPALPRSTARNSWSASDGTSRTPGCASLRWSDASTNSRASSPKRSSRLFSRTRRWAASLCLVSEQKCFASECDFTVCVFAGEWRWWRHRPADFLCVLQPSHQSKSGTETHGEMLRQGDYLRRLVTHSKVYLQYHKHLSLSWQYESQTSFGSMYPTRIEG